MTQTVQTRPDPKIDTLQRVYAAFGRGDVETILAEVGEDVDWAAEAASRSAPWYGGHAGKAAVARFFRELDSAVEVTEFTPLSFTSNDTDVMVVIRWTVTGRATGRTATLNLHHWFRFTDGKITLYRGSEDSERTAALFA